MNTLVVWTVGQRPTLRVRLADTASALAFHFRYRLIGAHS